MFKFPTKPVTRKGDSNGVCLTNVNWQFALELLLSAITPNNGVDYNAIVVTVLLV